MPRSIMMKALVDYVKCPDSGNRCQDFIEITFQYMLSGRDWDGPTFNYTVDQSLGPFKLEVLCQIDV